MSNTEENIKVIEGTVDIDIPNDEQDYSQTKRSTTDILNKRYFIKKNFYYKYIYIKKAKDLYP